MTDYLKTLIEQEFTASEQEAILVQMADAVEPAKQPTEQLSQIIIHPEDYEYLTGEQDTSFFGKLKWGWKLFALSFSDWQDAMVSEEYVDDFFYYLGSCKVL